MRSSQEVANSDELAALADTHKIGVTQVVTDGPEGDVTYHLRLGDGSASFGARAGRCRRRAHGAVVGHRRGRRHG